MTDECEVCGKKTNCLGDYFAMICQDCIHEHTDIVLLQRIGSLIRELKKCKEE